jgi:hypothetical protein
MSNLILIVDVDIKRAEPFVRLAQAEGALADESLNLDYLNQFPSSALWCSLRDRHIGVLLSTLTYNLCAGVLTILSAFYVERIENPVYIGADEVLDVVHSTVTLRPHPTFVSLVSAVLALIAAGLTAVAWRCSRTCTGVRSNPTTLLGLIKVSREQRFRDDFAQMSTWTTIKQLKEMLHGRRYYLHSSPDPHIESHILPASNEPLRNEHLENIRRRADFGEWRFCWKKGQPFGLQPFMLFLTAAVLIIWYFLLGFHVVDNLTFRTRKAISISLSVGARVYLDLLDRGGCEYDKLHSCPKGLTNRSLGR